MRDGPGAGEYFRGDDRYTVRLAEVSQLEYNLLLPDERLLCFLVGLRTEIAVRKSLMDFVRLNWATNSEILLLDGTYKSFRTLQNLKPGPKPGGLPVARKQNANGPVT